MECVKCLAENVFNKKFLYYGKHFPEERV